MLTEELLKSNAILSTLSEDQIKAITTLSKNDEDAVIGQHRKTWWERLDQDIAQIT